MALNILESQVLPRIARHGTNYGKAMSCCAFWQDAFQLGQVLQPPLPWQ
ncbi:hypothetical protein FKG94_07855 [Exilibacterium tricleocarpae]|uniref:Uncharacterized protein n=1 Tax=Exilibacterium tricleocarpae TaxID=2591008 RepID=A0A545TZM0_9GAMM|nr:hypothetical protein FKG94_07855 [Exilibacterium tricleocarpae]